MEFVGLEPSVMGVRLQERESLSNGLRPLGEAGVSVEAPQIFGCFPGEEKAERHVPRLPDAFLGAKDPR
jgi:hypothetical protein